MVLGAIVLALFLLYPTYVDYQNNKDINKILEERKQQFLAVNPDLTLSQLDDMLRVVEDSLLSADPEITKNREKRVKLGLDLITKNREKRVKLGLDLQGGMRVVLEVSTSQLLAKLANNPDDTFEEILKESEEEAILSDESIVDIVGRKLTERGIRYSRYFGTIRQDDDQILGGLKDDTDDAVTRALEIIRNRIDQYGVAEPSIQRQGSRRIIVELPGVAREEEAKQLLQGTALLEFRLLKEPEFTISVMQKIDESLAKAMGVFNTDTTQIEIGDTSIAEGDTSLVSNDSLSTEDLSEEEFKRIQKAASILYNCLVRSSGQ